MNVSIRVKQIRGVEAVYSTVRRELVVDLDMTGDQCKDAILDLINHDNERDVYEWLKSSFPEWFEVTA